MVYTVPSQAVPIPSEVDRMKTTSENFGIYGFAEYCDEFGTFHCDGFAVAYIPNASRWVISNPANCDTNFMSDQSPACSTWGPGETDKLIPLPRCVQPQEEADEQKRQREIASHIKPIPLPPRFDRKVPVRADHPDRQNCCGRPQDDE
jgi:hypothetical protein